jgi:hypothetical protein
MSRINIDYVDSFHFGFTVVSPVTGDFEGGHVSPFFEIEAEDFGAGTSNEGVGGWRMVAEGPTVGGESDRVSLEVERFRPVCREHLKVSSDSQLGLRMTERFRDSH